MDSMYRDEIVEHYKNPLHFGKLKHPTTSAHQRNPLCGDDITIEIEFTNQRHSGNPPLAEHPESNRTDPGQSQDDKDEDVDNKAIVKDIAFLGVGCAISIAAASILTDYAVGKTKTALTNLSEEAMLDLLGVEVSAARRKCALLALFTLKDCLFTYA